MSFLGYEGGDMKNTLIFLFTIVGLTVTLGAEKTYRLENLIDMLKSNNLLFKIHEIEKNLTKQEYKINQLLPNPEIEFFRGKGEVFEAQEYRLVWGVHFKFEIPNPLYRYLFLKSEKQSISKARIIAEIKNRSLIKKFKNHFFRYQYFITIDLFLIEKQKILEEINKITKMKVSIGEAREIDYLRSSVELQKNKTAGFKIRKRIAYEKTKINEFLNYVLPDNFKIIKDFDITPLPHIEKTIEDLIKNGPFVELKGSEVEQKKLKVRANRFSIIESFEIFIEKDKEVDADVWRWGVGIAIPIFNTKYLSVQKAKMEQEKAQKELEHIRKHLFADVQRMIAEIRISEKEIETFRGAVLKEGSENLELSRKMYLSGEVPLVVFLDSQNSFFEIEKRYYEAITEWKILKSELEELLGVEL